MLLSPLRLQVVWEHAFLRSRSGAPGRRMCLGGHACTVVAVAAMYRAAHGHTALFLLAILFLLAASQLGTSLHQRWPKKGHMNI